VGTAEVVVGAVSIIGTVQYDTPVYLATVTGSMGQATITGVATGVPPVYTAGVLLASPASVLSGLAQSYKPVATATVLVTVPTTTTTASATTDTPIYSATCQIVITGCILESVSGAGILVEQIGLIRSPADILRHLVVIAGIDGCSLPEEKTTKPFYVGFMPNTPNDAQVTYDVEGTADGRSHPTGISWLHYGVTLVVRNDTYENAWSSMKSILDYFDTVVRNTTVEIDGTIFNVVCVNRQGNPYSMGQDPPKEGWIKLGVNLKAPIVQLKRITT